MILYLFTLLSNTLTVKLFVEITLKKELFEGWTHRFYRLNLLLTSKIKMAIQHNWNTKNQGRVDSDELGEVGVIRTGGTSVLFPLFN